MAEQTKGYVGGSDLVTADLAATLWGLFCERVRRSPDAVAYRYHDSTAGEWCDYTWRMIGGRVDHFRSALSCEDLRAGDRVGILLPNGIDWVCLDLAAHALGLVVVGLYPHETAAGNAYILGHSGARLVLVDTPTRWQALRPFRSELPSLDRVWIRDSSDGSLEATSGLIVRELGQILADASSPPPPHPAAASDIATLIYTSGTTGRPKGVMLSHFALLWNAQATAANIPPWRDDVFLSILPLAHAFERTVGHYLPMMGGCTVAYARSAQELPADLAAVRPTALLGVPLLFERMSAAIQRSVAGSFAKRNLLRIAAELGWRSLEAKRRGGGSGLPARLLGPVLKRWVAKPVLAAFGGRLRVAVSGGAPLERGVGHFLIGLGLPLVEGYGLTEAAPVVAANGLDDNVLGSAGRPLEGIEVKLTAEGELLVHSPSRMAGYWKDDAATARTLDPTGWLSTGDLAEIRDGRIFICGRLKQTIVLSIGEKVNPNIVEEALTRDPLFRQAVVVGDRRPFLAAIIVLDSDVWKRFAADNGLDPELPNHKASRIKVVARIAQLLAALPKHAQVLSMHLTLRPWTIDDGLLTPTFKVKRGAILPLFAKEIDELYGGP